MDSVYERLSKAYEILFNSGKIHSQSDLADKIGQQRAQVNKALKGDPRRCTIGLMKRIADAFPDTLSRDYLLTGEGAPERPADRRPHFANHAATAGYAGPASEAVLPVDVAWHTFFPEMGDYDFTLPVTGSSMEPVLQPDDILYCRYATDRSEILTDHIYVVMSTEETVVKKIKEVREDGLLLSSVNPDFLDYFMPAENIRSLARVIGSVRYF